CTRDVDAHRFDRVAHDPDHVHRHGNRDDRLDHSLDDGYGRGQGSLVEFQASRTGEAGSAQHLPDGACVVVRLGESRRLLPRHSCGDEFAAEASHAPLPFRLEVHEADADLHRQDPDGRHYDEREAVVVAGHHSLPWLRLPMAFENITARFRDDLYWYVNLNDYRSV